MYSYYREYSFRQVFGGSHEDYMTQPLEVTDLLSQIHGRLNSKSE